MSTDIALTAQDSALGMGHFIAHADVVGKTLLIMLLGMSVLSWAILAVRRPPIKPPVAPGALLGIGGQRASVSASVSVSVFVFVFEGGSRLAVLRLA